MIAEIILNLFRKYVWLKAMRLQCLNQVGDLHIVILSETLCGEVYHNLAIFFRIIVRSGRFILVLGHQLGFLVIIKQLEQLLDFLRVIRSLYKLLSFLVQMIEILALDEETLLDFLPIGFLDNHFFLQKLDIIVNFLDYLVSPLVIISVRLGDMVKPQRCMPYLVQSGLKQLNLLVFGLFLLLNIARVDL